MTESGCDSCVLGGAIWLLPDTIPIFAADPEVTISEKVKLEIPLALEMIVSAPAFAEVV